VGFGVQHQVAPVHFGGNVFGGEIGAEVVFEVAAGGEQVNVLGLHYNSPAHAGLAVAYGLEGKDVFFGEEMVGGKIFCGYHAPAHIGAS